MNETRLIQVKTPPSLAKRDTWTWKDWTFGVNFCSKWDILTKNFNPPKRICLIHTVDLFFITGLKIIIVYSTISSFSTKSTGAQGILKPKSGIPREEGDYKGAARGMIKNPNPPTPEVLLTEVLISRGHLCS